MRSAQPSFRPCCTAPIPPQTHRVRYEEGCCDMKLTRDLKIARRSLSTALRAASAMMRLPGATTPTEFSRYAAGSGGVIETTTSQQPGQAGDAGLCPAHASGPGAPLVVVLHGCGQDAAAFAADTAGWRWPTGSASPCCSRSRVRRTTAAAASTGSAPPTPAGAAARRCRSAR